MYRDQTIPCADCGQEFTFTAGEQEFYAQKGFTEPPKRCPACRSARKAQRGSTGVGASSGSGSYGGGYSGGSSYGNGGDGGYGGGYSSRGSYSTGGTGGGYGGGAERRPRQLYDATCANCGQPALVPFQPTGARPVYCSNCFQQKRG